MVLNHECVRDVLLFIESEFKDIRNYENSLCLKICDYKSDDINYACLKLYEAGYINGNPQPTGKYHSFIFVFGLTWQGHEFLDNIREEKSWTKTKSIINKIGSASLNIISSTASKVIIGLINQELAKADLL